MKIHSDSPVGREGIQGKQQFIPQKNIQDQPAPRLSPLVTPQLTKKHEQAQVRSSETSLDQQTPHSADL